MSSQLHWNAGGWFGGQIGGTCWILVAAILTAFQDEKTAVALGLLFLIPNAMGVYLWLRQSWWSALAAMQTLLVVSGAAGLAAIWVLQSRMLWEPIQTGQSVSAYSAYLILICTMGTLMCMFYLRFGRTPRAQ